MCPSLCCLSVCLLYKLRQIRSNRTSQPVCRCWQPRTCLILKPPTSILFNKPLWADVSRCFRPFTNTNNNINNSKIRKKLISTLNTETHTAVLHQHALLEALRTFLVLSFWASVLLSGSLNLKPGMDRSTWAHATKCIFPHSFRRLL